MLFVPTTKDAAGSADHPELGRIPGALIHQYKYHRFGIVNFPLAMDRRGIKEVGRAEGEVWKIKYYLPSDMGPDGAAAIYRRNLEERGFQIVVDHVDPDGVTALSREEKKIGEKFPPLSHPIHILVGKGTLRGGEVTVVVYAFTERTTWGDHQ